MQIKTLLKMLVLGRFSILTLIALAPSTVKLDDKSPIETHISKERG